MEFQPTFGINLLSVMSYESRVIGPIYENRVRKKHLRAKWCANLLCNSIKSSEVNATTVNSDFLSRVL